MIKPASLWGLMKTCDDSAWLGTICRALGGQDVELDVGQRNMLSVIKLDSGWMDERLEAQRERWRDRKRAYRAKDGAEQDETSETNETCPTLSSVSQCHVTSVPPSVPPSVRPSVPPESKDSLESVCITPARTVSLDRPKKGDVVTAATSTMGVPEWYAEWWYDQMAACDWKKTNGQEIAAHNWRAVLMAWWRKADDKERERIQNERKRPATPSVRHYGATDWELCGERCEAFKAGRCACGCIVPPQFRPRPIPPEECQGFRKKED